MSAAQVEADTPPEQPIDAAAYVGLDVGHVVYVRCRVMSHRKDSFGRPYVDLEPINAGRKPDLGGPFVVSCRPGAGCILTAKQLTDHINALAAAKADKAAKKGGGQ